MSNKKKIVVNCLNCLKLIKENNYLKKIVKQDFVYKPKKKTKMITDDELRKTLDGIFLL